ncbi:proline-rich protein PRCC [Phymastichus coffea]|uniref:proline-rich protein PRCC n=1 Tax=Phymastichus coffea TaxID=108790 RepID=UPI00273C8781|nr:proline-rich protein PRCC [Phymastichus coffea]
MSLVAYGSSDESENDEETGETSPIAQRTESKVQIKFPLPIPRTSYINQDSIRNGKNDSIESKLDFNVLPGPVALSNNYAITEADNLPLPKKVDYSNVEKPPKKKKGPTKIIIPSLADFQDDDDDSKPISHNKKHPSQKGSGLIGILPPPKSLSMTANSMIPNVLTKKAPASRTPVQETSNNLQPTKIIQKAFQSKSTAPTLKSLSSYNSDSEEEDDKHQSLSVQDFFSLSTPSKISDEHLPSLSAEDMKLETIQESSHVKEPETIVSSSVMNLPKQEILLKNKVEVGPKLPVPEQEAHLDKQGNIVLNEQSIQYLCGRQGVKRKHELENIEIIDINGEDMKPDEREWMVKALTEEQVHRPLNMGAGPSGTSKKKHQITYLAHQAKAMELELKNQWAQNKANRQQTRQKYGF